MCVCEGLYGRSLHNSLMWDLESPLVEEFYHDVHDTLKVYMRLIRRNLEGCLGTSKEGVWAVTLCVT